MMPARPVHDVAIAGDGPAGLALGAACVAAGLDTVIVGDDAPWTATYGAWVDELGPHAATIASRVDVDVVARTRIALGREYGVFDNGRLRDSLDVAPRREGRVVAADSHEAVSAFVTDTGARVTARVLVDATGSRPALGERRRPGRGRTVFQSAYGVVLDRRPDGVENAVLMDWTRTSPGEATFLYAVPIDATRWLVEETSLARTAPMPADELRRRLAVRLGRDLSAEAERVEHVVIPMRTGLPSRGDRVVAFGAAAGYVHPATGYSVTASLRAAPRVAAALRSGDPVTAWNAVWPGEHRRARALHDYGLAALLRMSPDELIDFFDAFFRLPRERWADYLRVDTSGASVAATMSAVFTSVPWSVRRRLVGSTVARRGPSRSPRTC